MKNLILLLLLLSMHITLFAHTSIKKLGFESGISIYGKVGFIDIILEEDDEKQTYRMEVTASSTGLVKALTNNRRDTFVSEGYIKNGVYFPTKFMRETSKTDYKRLTTYIFDYKKKIVIKNRVVTEVQRQSHLNIVNMEIINTKKTKIIESYIRNIKLYANDFLSLYLNMQNGNLKKGKINYIDMSPKDTLLLIEKNKIEVQKHNGKEKYNIEIFYDTNSIFFKKLISEDIAFYGDAYIKKVYEKVSL